MDMIQEKKKTFRSILFWSIFYVIFFPVALWCSLEGGLIGENSHVPYVVVLAAVFSFMCVPVSMPVTIVMMRRKYVAQDYEKTRQYCALPLFIFIGTFFFSSILFAAVRHIAS